MPKDAFFAVAPLPAPAGAVLLIALDDLDHSSAEEAWAHALAVVADRPAAVVVDLTGRFLDASGIRALLGIARAADSDQVPLTIIGWPEWLGRLAPLLAVERLPLCADLPAAVVMLRSLSGADPG